MGLSNCESHDTVGGGHRARGLLHTIALSFVEFAVLERREIIVIVDDGGCHGGEAGGGGYEFFKRHTYIIVKHVN